MTLTFGTIATLAWPFVLAGVAWGIAVWALTQPDEQSRLVKRLTTGTIGQQRTSHFPRPTSPVQAQPNSDMETIES